MDKQEFLSLCARRESEQLDFKEKSYSKANRQELAKDLVAMVNETPGGFVQRTHLCSMMVFLLGWVSI